MTQAARLPVVLRAAAVWGTTVIGMRHLCRGQSLRFGGFEEEALPRPDKSPMPDTPIRATAGGFELDARGATGGIVYLRGRRENGADLGRAVAPIPIVAGDFGVVQFGPSFSVFFQFTTQPPMLGSRIKIEWGLVLAFVFSVVAICGGMAMIWAITTPPAIAKPLELTSAAELAVQFNLKAEPAEPEKPGKDSDADKGQGIKDPGAKDKKDQGGGRKIKGAEGQLGRQGDADKTELKGEIRSGLAEALNSEVGEEVKKTLNTISSVADALGGLRSDQIVLGRGLGTGLRGNGPGGGGDSDGVPFGSGTMDTGWGPGRGGGFGAGSGGPGAKGLGGMGRGGKDGSGDGTGVGEKKVAGKDAPKPGQGLSPSQISRVVMSRYGAFRACYEASAAANPNLSGSVSVSFSIAPSGSVAGASIASSSLGNPRVEGCVLRQFNRLSFPSADKPTGAVWPFLFKPGKK